MLQRSIFLLSALLAVNTALAQGGQTCNATSLCLADAPCCSEYGFCGTGTFCLGGCNALYSHSLTSCAPEPVCRNANYTLADTSRILTNSSYYNGNASEYDFTVDAGSIFNASSQELAMILTESNNGTKLSSTHYVHYGTITARIKTGRWGGVVTAFILMSDVKDEIDWEFPGNATTEGQSNYFWQGNIPAQTAGEVHGNMTDTYANYHDFTPSALTWLIDGNVVRTLKQSDLVQNGVSQYPNTPARIQLSIWPAGINSSPPGTVEWAGGMINWNDPDYVSAGHFYALVESVNVTCADPQSTSGDIVSYMYSTNTSTDTPGILYSNASTVINGAGTSVGSPLGGNWINVIVAAVFILLPIFY